GYNFDGCSPQMLAEASVKNHKIVFPGGASYHLLVMPIQKTMTPHVLAKIEELIRAGANVIGIPPLKSPSLVNYPQCDVNVKKTAEKIWDTTLPPKEITVQKCGKGKIYWGGDLSYSPDNELYPSYEATSFLLKQMGVDEDFKSSNGKIRYTHKKLKDADIYFIANRTDDTFQTKCSFRVEEGAIELWNPLTGEIRELPQYTREKNYTSLPLTFDAFQSYFIVFDTTKTPTKNNNAKNFSNLVPLQQIEGEWNVSFDPRWGGPEEAVFPSLSDWSQNKDEGIKYYSGIATYKKIFNFNSKVNGERIYLHLGEVKNIARVKLNEKELGVVWTAPWQVEITDVLTEGENHLEIDVANLWINRLIGDEHYPDDGIKNGKWPEWLVNKTPRPTKRFTFSTYKFYTKDSPLVKSGLLGPVQLLITEN
ncbi:MAG: glycosylhydrolase-like jelly roll fold domain-containing protein, partial [Dysgonamonadaceae bacterium]